MIQWYNWYKVIEMITYRAPVQLLLQIQRYNGTTDTSFEMTAQYSTVLINWSEAFARSAREGEGPTIERYGIKQLVSRPLLEKWAVFTLPPSLLACKSYNATREPLPLGRSPIKCPSCGRHSPQPARHDGAGRREVEVEPNHHPGDLPHHHQHHLHRPGAALQLRYLAQSCLFLQSQLTVQNICIYFLP